MARVTVEDCVKKVPNRFRLVLLSTERARELSSGALPTVARDNDKNPVIALREIAAGAVSVDALDSRYREEIRNQLSGFASKMTRDAELERTIADEGTSYLNQSAGEIDIFAAIGKERESRGEDDLDGFDELEEEDEFEDDEDGWGLGSSDRADKLEKKAPNAPTDTTA